MSSISFGDLTSTIHGINSRLVCLGCHEKMYANEGMIV
jgi:hypothetical protein